MDVTKLKVVELRQELQARGLDTKGVKAVLAARLIEALEAESGDGNENEQALPDPLEEPADSPVEEKEPEIEEEPQQVEEPIVEPEIPDPVPVEEERIDEPEPVQPEEPAESLISNPEPVEEEEKEEKGFGEESLPSYSFNETVPMMDEAEDSSQSRPPQDNNQDSMAEESRPEDEQNEKINSEKEEEPQREDISENQESMDFSQEGDDSQKPTDKEGNQEEETEVKKSEEKKEEEESRKRKRSRSPSSSSSRPPKSHQPAAKPDDFLSVEDEPETIDPEKVTLNWFDSDLNLRISTTDFCDARPLSDAALGLVWAGARATHGVTSGKVFYEVQLSQKNNRVHIPDQKNLFNLRCGWSTKHADLQLGKSPNSFGFDGQGKKVRNNEFQDYGTAFGINDVVGVYLDLESEPCTVEYTVNGDSLGAAFEFDKADLEGEALYPHIISKNVSFKVNFGQLEDNLLKDLKVMLPKKEEVKEVKAEESKDEEKSEEKKPEGNGEVTNEESESKDAEQQEEEKKEDSEEKPEPMEQEEEKTEEKAVEEEAAKPEEKEEEKEEEQEKEINRENLPGYEFIGRVEKESLIPGPVRPESRKECEVVLMIGLPGAGKTVWAQKYVDENPEKRYDIIGSTSLINRMQIDGLPNRLEVGGRRQRLSELCTKALAVLHDMAQKRRRNYILDQTNVFASAQRRTMKGFGDFRRIAVVVIPDDEEYVKRQASGKSEAESGGDNSKDLSETEINEMKANYTLPSLDLGWFDEIKYSDLEGEAATKLVEDYNSKGRKALPPPSNKRPNYDYRNDRRRRDFDNRDNRYSRWSGGGGGGSDRRMGGGMYDNRDRWNNAPGSYGGGYRPHPRDYSGGYDRRAGGDRWGGGGGGGAGQWVNNNRRSYQERDYRSGGAGRSDYGRSDYRSSGGPPQHRDYQPHHHRDSSNRRRNDGRDQDFRERSRDNHGGGGKRHDSMDRRGSGRDYHKRDHNSSSMSKGYDSSKPSSGQDMSSNGSTSGWNWNSQQQQWVASGNSWQQPQVDQWGQQWAGHQQVAQQGWQNWSAQQMPGTTTTAAQWKSYGATQQSGTGEAGAEQWDSQWTGF